MNRFFRIAAFGLVAGLALSTTSQAGTTYINTVTAVNTLKPADDIEVTFTGTGGTISDVKLLAAPAGSTSKIIGGNTVEVDFGSPLPTFGATTFQFMTDFGPIAISNAVWTYKTAGPKSVPTGTVILISTAVPEPSSMALLGIGMASFFSFRRLMRRKAVA